MDCPFCEGSPVLIQMGHQYWIECKSCKTQGPGPSPDSEGAWTLWNNRSPSPEESEEVTDDEVEEAIAEISSNRSASAAHLYRMGAMESEHRSETYRSGARWAMVLSIFILIANLATCTFSQELAEDAVKNMAEEKMCR